VDDDILPSNTDLWDAGHRTVESQTRRRERLLVLCASALIVLAVAGGAAYLLFGPAPSLQERADRIVIDVQAVQEQGCDIVIPKGIFSKGTPKDFAEKAVSSAVFQSKEGGADATSSDLRETEDGRWAAVAVGIRCP
jgi:hypothetical protein